MANSNDYLYKLSDKIWSTKIARFTAYRRMKRCDVASVIATAMSSANIIAVSILCYFKKEGKSIVSSDNVTAISIVLSVLALVLSLVVTLLKYSERKNNYHNCGLALESLNQHIKICIKESEDADIPISYNRVKQFLNDYEKILSKSNLNHTKFDYAYAIYDDKRNNSSEAVDTLVKIKMWFRWNILDVSFLYWLIAFLPTIAIFIYLWLGLFIS